MAGLSIWPKNYIYIFSSQRVKPSLYRVFRQFNVMNGLDGNPNKNVYSSYHYIVRYGTESFIYL